MGAEEDNVNLRLHQEESEVDERSVLGSALLENNLVTRSECDKLEALIVKTREDQQQIEEYRLLLIEDLRLNLKQKWDSKKDSIYFTIIMLAAIAAFVAIALGK